MTFAYPLVQPGSRFVIGTIKGVWNASTNSPSLASGVGTQNDAWIVGTAGTTALDGTSTWAVADLVVFASGAWKRAPFSSVYGSMALQNANAIAGTGGSLANMSSVGVIGGGSIGPATGAPDDAYFADADGAVMLKYSNGSGTFIFAAPISASAGTFATLTATTLSAASATLTSFITSQITFDIGASPDSVMYPATTPYSAQPLLVFLDADNGVINKMLRDTGELSHQKATGVPASLMNAGRYRTRLTAKPVFSEQASVNSTANTTYAAIFTTEGQPSSVRFIVPSAGAAATIKMAYAFSDSVNDGINPVIGGKAAAWTTVTWTNAGADVDYNAQLLALNLANMVAPTTFSLPVADTVNYGNNSPNQIFHWYLTDWMPGTAPLRADGGSGASLVFVRIYVTTGTLALAANNGDVSGAYESFLFGRTLRAFSQAVDGVTTPANFTSTTRTGLFAVHGVQYESLNRGACIMTGGDSTTAGTGSDFGIWGAWRRLAMAFSTPTAPVELANFAQPAADFYTYSVQMGLAVDWVKPTVAYLQPWSRNSWKDTSLGGWPATLQIAMGGTITAGNTVTATITDTNVTGSPLSVTYTVLMGDTLATVAAGLAAAITATTALFSAGYRASSNGVWTNIRFPSALPSAGTAAVSGGATLTATGYFNYVYMTQQIADMSLAASLSIADRVESYGGVYFTATMYGDIGMTLQTDATRQAVNTAIRAMSRAVVAEYDTALSLATGPAGAPMISSANSSDNVHPNDTGHAIEFGILQPLYKAVYGL